MSTRLRYAAILILLSCSAFAQQSRFQIQEAVSNSDAGTVDVIVRFRPSPDQVGLKRFLDRGAQHKRDLGLIRASVLTVKTKDLDLLAADPEVEMISPDYRLSATGFTGGPDYGWMTALGVSSQGLGMSALGSSMFGGPGNNNNGNNIGVAIIDSGISTTNNVNTDLQGSGGTASNGRVVYSQSFVPGDTTTSDAYGHGTHVAGIVAGDGVDSTGSMYTYTIRGIAPAANLINLRVLNGSGEGSDSLVIAALQAAVQLKSTYNIRVVNLSLGRPVYSSYTTDPLCQAVEAAWQAGIVVVVAAGNEGRNNSQGTDGYATITAPGNDPFVITVGAMNTVGTLSRLDDKITSYSSKGPTLLDHIVKPDLVAPGNNILSLRQPGSYLAVTYPQNSVPVGVYAVGSSTQIGNYFQLSGTSMATPMVSGAAALIIQNSPNVSPDTVKARLMKTATKFPQGTSTATDPSTGITYTSQYDVFTIGAGYLYIPAALNNSDVANGSAMSPTAVPNSNGSVSLVGASSSIWGNALIWGSSLIWGGSALTGSAIIWGSSLIWGGTGVEGETVIWGSSTIWGSAAASTDATAISIVGEN
jgi:serine protease AprX